MSLLSGKKILLLGFAVVLLVVIPLTVYLVQQQQKLSVGAQKASTLSFAVSSGSSSTLNTATDVAKFDVKLDPTTNQVSVVKLVINFDSTKLKVANFDPNTSVFPTTLQAASFANSPATMTVSIGQNTGSFPQGSVTVATIGFSALPGAPPGQYPIQFDQTATGTQVLSLGGTDQFNENVLNIATPTNVTIAQAIAGGGTPTPTPTPTPSGSPTPTPSSSPTTQGPVCTALNTDKQSGAAPLAVNFTAIGNEPGGKITKVTFNWGDGPTQSVTDTGNAGGGVGTSSVNTELVHTYNNSGTFTASATLTDSNNLVSAVGVCTKTITVSASSGTAGGGSAGSGGTGTTQVATVGTTGGTGATGTGGAGGATTKGGLPATGPGDRVISLGALGIISTIVGALLLFGL